MNKQLHKVISRATVFVAVAFVVISCSTKLKATGEVNSKDLPVQVVDDMEIVQTDKGVLKMRMQTPLMESYQSDSLDWQKFPEGFAAYVYDENGKLETEIKGESAYHSKQTKGGSEELWEAYNNVVITNLIEHRVMETDTLYWNPVTETIYTDCYVRITDPRGLMQGYGMESDQRARRSTLRRVFNNYALIESDSTAVVIDSINFIGPFPLK